MSRTRVKICGIRTLADARAAVAAGADALGFNFYRESPRYVEPDEAARIIAALPGFVTMVGVSVNDPPARLAVLKATGIDLLQFHGDEDNAACEAAGSPFLRAVRVRSLADVAAARANYPRSRGLLVDPLVEGRYGGTGEPLDWSVGATGIADLILAGGLDPDNVAVAIRQVRPWAVDVSSGVERSRGVKDTALIQRFMAAVQAVDEELTSHG